MKHVNDACLVSKKEYEELRSIVYNMKVYGGRPHYWGVKHKPERLLAGMNITIENDKQVGKSQTDVAYACCVTGAPTGGIYPVTFHYEKHGEQIGAGYSTPQTLHISEVVAVGNWFVGSPSQSTFLPGEES